MTRTHYKSLIESDFLGQWDLTDPKTGRSFEPTVEIASATRYIPPVKRQKKMPDGSYKDEKNKRIEIAFVGKKKHWLSGPATHATIVGMYGQYIEDWVGKRITLYVDLSIKFGKRKVGGIRVRPLVPGSNVPTTLEPLDEPVDEAKAAELDDAREWADKEA